MFLVTQKYAKRIVCRHSCFLVQVDVFHAALRGNVEEPVGELVGGLEPHSSAYSSKSSLHANSTALASA